VPILKVPPELWVFNTEGTPQLSVAVGAVQVTIATVSVVFWAIFTGQLAKTGFTVSLAQGFMTVTVKAQVAALLLESFAV
jgi:hypothetical protein